MCGSKWILASFFLTQLVDTQSVVTRCLIVFDRYLIYNSPQNICICVHLCLSFLELARSREIFQGASLLTVLGELNEQRHWNGATNWVQNISGSYFILLLIVPCLEYVG
jgi:hypothetical protein